MPVSPDSDNPARRETLAPGPARSYGKAVFSALAVAIVLGGVGFAFLALDLVGPGLSAFIALPLAMGLVSSLVLGSLRGSLLAGTLAVVVACAGLLFVGIEGLVCVVLASPLIFLSSAVGALAGALLTATVRKKSFLVISLGIVAFAGTSTNELRFGSFGPAYTVIDSVEIEAPIEETWSSVASVSSVRGPKPFLLRLGLPVPLRCELQDEGTGAKRVCHFDRGRIEELVSVWEPPRRLEAVVVETDLPGREWLAFHKAEYVLSPISPHRTRIVRTTWQSSRLRPRWYWKPLETLGTSQEHEYVLTALKTRLEAGP
ncbi:MAG: hypothetical protein OEQ13_01680 [Acidobacteriota bacterium]|nr:hypothetical protein [Acidobacteriota bacterium]